MTSPVDGIPVPTRDALSYSSYLKVDALLKLQEPRSVPTEHDEMLFIIIHQVYELWFKQILHEVNHIEAAAATDDIMTILHTCRRVTAVQSILNQQVDVLETMTPYDFNRFRDNINPASGFQSVQFRLLEFRLGNREGAYMKFHATSPEAHAALEDALRRPSLNDVLIGILARRGLGIAPEVAKRDVTQQYTGDDSVLQAVLTVYREPRKHSDLYLLLEALIDVDEKLILWRYRHVAMVERMIGARLGTGGSPGVSYLKKTLEKKYFPDLWRARDHLGKGPY